MIKPVYRDNRGLTLVELMVGVMILAIVVVPLLHTFITSAGTQRKSEIYRNATDEAQNQIETIEAANIEEYISDSGAVVGTDATTGKKTYTIQRDGVSSGSSTFDVLTTLNENTVANTTSVAFANPMDAIIDMNSADQVALSALNAQLNGLTDISPQPTLKNLTRTITITAIKGTESYTLDTVFTYTGRFSGTDESDKAASINFSHSIESSADVKIASSFSLYVFFHAYYSSRDTIIIRNPDYSNSDFKVFLVNTNSQAPEVGYKADIRYFYQTDKNKNLVFTNISISSYKAFYTDDTWFQAIPTLDASLVELKKLDRKYTVNVRVYKHGTNYEGTPIADMDFDKLN